MTKQDTDLVEIDVEEKATEGQANSIKLESLLDTDFLGDVTVELTASLGRGNITLAELANLKDGAQITLDTPLNGMVDLSLNGRIVARGELVSIGDNFGVHIKEILVKKA